MFLERVTRLAVDLSTAPMPSPTPLPCLVAVASIMEITGDFGFNPVLSPAIFGFDLFYQLMELRSWIQYKCFAYG
ncbi:unnamed protein product [Rotaria magnacalcarata]